MYWPTDVKSKIISLPTVISWEKKISFLRNKNSKFLSHINVKAKLDYLSEVWVFKPTD